MRDTDFGRPDEDPLYGSPPGPTDELLYLIDLKMRCGLRDARGLLDLLIAHDYSVIKNSQSGRTP